MIYVALLRGINVGGKNKIEMKQLKKTFEEVGMKSVVTYLNTGNIVFVSHGLSKKEIIDILEEAILKDFELAIKVVVRSLEDYKMMMKSLPDTWRNDQHMKSDVLFLFDSIDNKAVLDKFVIKPEIDTVKYVPGAILWSVSKGNATKSGLTKIIGTDLYKAVTIRNVNTTRKIYELMQAANQ